jgi:hypothetical protein
MQMSPTRVIAAADPSAFAARHESLLITPLHTKAQDRWHCLLMPRLKFAGPPKAHAYVAPIPLCC